MLIGMAICAALILARNLLAMASGIGRRSATATTGPAFGGTQYDSRRAALGIVLVLIYGFAIPWVGFAIATFAFVAIWMIVGDVRKPVTVAAVTILGTIVTLWFFAGVALMPLDLGRGAFESTTIALYRALRIY
jgi:putative tricarboxylic transport membrane protein